MVWVTIMAAMLYASLLGVAAGLWIFHAGKKKQDAPEFQKNSFTLLVPFRNEEERLRNLIVSLSNQTLVRDQWECLFIDDHSTDQSLEALHPSFNFYSKLISSNGEGKKAAILTGCLISKYDYIIQTDADCIPNETWLSSISRLKGDQTNIIITGPVAIQNPNSILDHFQSMDTIAMMGMTFAGIKTGWWHMGNGANLAYPKSVRLNTLLSSVSDQFASGDDMFLIESAIQSKQATILFNFNPDAIVHTSACPDLTSFIHQRLRWGTKNSRMKSPGLKIALGITLGFNILLVVLLITALFNPGWIHIAFFLWIQKWVIDFIYLKSIEPFFNSKIKLPVYLVCAFLYPFYSLVITLLSIFKRKYEWKGRMVR